jgi:hypothetical protein
MELVPESETEAELVRAEWAGHAHLPRVGPGRWRCVWTWVRLTRARVAWWVFSFLLCLSGLGIRSFIFFFIYPFIRLLVLALRWGLWLYSL